MIVVRQFQRPEILISSCIGDCKCRYDGSNAKSDVIEMLEPFVNFTTVCPEVEIGLPIPRQALRIISPKAEEERLVFSKTGEDLTDKMQSFTDKFLDQLDVENLDGAVLKSRSPSCGIKDVKVYKSYGKSSPASKKSKGIFAKNLIEKFDHLAVEDEGRLTNYDIREHFLTRIFTLADFKQIKLGKSMKELIKFHSDNKYLLMVYSQVNLKHLGRIVGNHENKTIEEILDEYQVYLHKALSRKSSTKRNINMLLHLFGYFSKDVSQEEKAYFLENLDDYTNSRIPFSVPLSLLRSWVVRFDNSYLRDQTIFQSFPQTLTDVRDSGKNV